MITRIVIITVAWVVWLSGGVSAHAEGPSGHRAALLVGNFAYEEAKLPGVGASLDHVQQALESQGYAVTRLENLGEKPFKEAIERFARSVPTNGVAAVYYVGLGAHVERLGKMYNVLRPLDVSIRNENDYRSRGIQVGEMIESLRQGGARVNLLFLDACVDSPIRPDDKNIRSGLIAFDTPPDTVVMFGAPSGKTSPAPTGAEPSAMAAAMAKHLGKLDTSVKAACEAMAKETGDAWFGGATERGIGEPSALPVADTLRAGTTPGEGYVNSVGMTFRWCPPGSFTMGSSRTEDPTTRDRAAVSVTLSDGFWIGEHEVTQCEYSAVLRKNPPRGFTEHPNAPFWGVSEGKHVDDFCKKLTELERKAGVLPDGWAYACPTEAQWEYACRAGSTTAFHFGNSPADLGTYGNFADKALRVTNPDYHYADARSDDGVAEALAPVGSYRPNAWGIRDMHGNVAEVVADHHTPELPGGTDPLARLEKNGQTVIRGGAWCSVPLYCESSFRNSLPGRDKHNFVGFRIVLKKID